jgi:hypothetical protein
MDESRRKKWVAWAVAAAIFVVLMVVTPAIPQNQEYHDFADQRTLFLGIQQATVVTKPQFFFLLMPPPKRLSHRSLFCPASCETIQA